MQTLDELRADFEQQSRRSLSLPLAGALVWTIAGVMGLLLPPGIGNFVVLFGTGAIFPLALVIARMRGEALISNRNPLAMLMATRPVPQLAQAT